MAAQWRYKLNAGNTNSLSKQILEQKKYCGGRDGFA